MHQPYICPTSNIFIWALVQYSQYQQPRSDLKLDQNPYFSQKMFLKIGFFSVFFVGMGLRFVKNQHFLYQNVRLDEAHFLSEHLTTKFQRLWLQNQAQRIFEKQGFSCLRQPYFGLAFDVSVCNC